MSQGWRRDGVEARHGFLRVLEALGERTAAHGEPQGEAEQGENH